jgi:hypothetical protein
VPDRPAVLFNVNLIGIGGANAFAVGSRGLKQ